VADVSLIIADIISQKAECGSCSSAYLRVSTQYIIYALWFHSHDMPMISRHQIVVVRDVRLQQSKRCPTLALFIDDTNSMDS